MKLLKRRKIYMKFIVHVDSNNYVTGLELTTLENGIIVPDEIYYSQNQNCYKYIDGKFIFDNNKKEKLDNLLKIQPEIEKLKRELATYDYIGVKISMGVSTREEYADKIAYTETLREKIRELENKLTM